jgi:hypothetical protein
MTILEAYNSGTLTKLNDLTYPEMDSRYTEQPYWAKPVPTNPADSNLKLEVQARKEEVERITEFLKSTQGIEFLAKQAALSLIEQKNLLGKIKLLNTGVQTIQAAANLIAQTSVNGLGVHFKNSFTSVTKYLSTSTSEFASINSTIIPVGTPTNPITTAPTNTSDTYHNSEIVERQANEETSTKLLNPITTRLTKYTSQTLGNPSRKILDFNNISKHGDDGTVIPYGKAQYGERVESILNTNTIVVKNRTRKTLETPLTAVVDEELDIVNSAGVVQESQTTLIKKLNTSGDLIPFNIIIENYEGEDKYLFFKALLDNFNDTFNANWTTQTYYGRGEEFHAYENFSRNIYIGFKIAATSRAELQPIYEKLNLLASTTAPTYLRGLFKRGTFVKVTVGDYLSRTRGFIENLSLSWSQDYPWEIGVLEGETVEGHENRIIRVPHILDCSIQFKPVYENIPETGVHPFIGPSDVFKNKPLNDT